MENKVALDAGREPRPLPSNLNEADAIYDNSVATDSPRNPRKV